MSHETPFDFGGEHVLK